MNTICTLVALACDSCGSEQDGSWWPGDGAMLSSETNEHIIIAGIWVFLLLLVMIAWRWTPDRFDRHQ